LHPTKGEVEYFWITRIAPNFHTTPESAKGAKAVAIGGLSTQTMGGAYELMRVSQDSTRMIIGR
jgi:hypothetical protein